MSTARDPTPEDRDQYFREKSYPFIIISILGPPGSGKSTICRHLFENYELVPFSVHEALRAWLHNNWHDKRALETQQKLKNNEPFDGGRVQQHLRDAINRYHKERMRGLALDGHPRRLEQIDTGFNTAAFQDEVPWLFLKDEHRQIPDLVLYLQVDEDNARARCIARDGDTDTTRDRFGEDWTEWVEDNCLDVYRKCGMLVEVDANGTKEETIANVEREIKTSGFIKQTVNGVGKKRSRE